MYTILNESHMFHKHGSTFLTHNSQLTVKIPQRGLTRPFGPVELTFSNFLGKSPGAGGPATQPSWRGSPGVRARGPEPHTLPLRPQRPGAVAGHRKSKRGRKGEKGKGKGGRGRGRRRGGRERARARARAPPGKARPEAPRPPRPARSRLPALTFQVTTGGGREPLLGFAAHQLQADLQHFRVPAAWGPAPPGSLRRALRSGAPRWPRAPSRAPAAPPRRLAAALRASPWPRPRLRLRSGRAC